MSNEDIPPCSKSVRITTNEYIALVRDARRFRKLAARYCDDASGRPTHGSIQLERWDAEWMDWVPLSNQPLAEIADALPEVEQLNSPSDPPRRS